MKNDRMKNDRMKSDRMKNDRIKSDRIKTDRIKSITDPNPHTYDTLLSTYLQPKHSSYIHSFALAYNLFSSYLLSFPHTY
jgi:hypothetical protein